MNDKEKWEREFFERFGADKIWVKPSEDNVNTILEIWSFFCRSLETARKERDGEWKKVIGEKLDTCLEGLPIDPMSMINQKFYCNDVVERLKEVKNDLLNEQ